jgi:hypothetical protein
MVIMHVLMEELLCQAVMEHALVLECLLSGAHKRLRLRPAMPCIKWCCFLRTWL